MEPKPVETPAPAAPESAAAPAPVETTQPKPAEPANPAPATAAATTTPARKYAERFDTVEELEKSYQASGVEARRLLQVAKESKEQIKAREAQIAAHAAELETFKLEKQLGPEIVDPTPEESANWTAKQWADHSVSKLKRDQLKDRLETQKKQAEATSKSAREARTNEVFARMDHMSKSTDEFPRFDDMMKEDENGRGPISDWVKLLPMLSGEPIAPLALYLIAVGHEALQKDRASRAATLKSEKEAAALAAASLPAAAGPSGAPAPQPEPSRTAAPEDDSDAGHNERLIASHNFGGKPILPYD